MKLLLGKRFSLLRLSSSPLQYERKECLLVLISLVYPHQQSTFSPQKLSCYGYGFHCMILPPQDWNVCIE